jgi:hypothetical protein
MRINEIVLTEEQLEEISAKDIGAGALAGMMALTPVSKAFGATQNTDPLPNKQTSTMVQKDVAGKQDLSKIAAKSPNYWEVEIEYNGKKIPMEFPFSIGTNKQQVTKSIQDWFASKGIKDGYSINKIDTLNKVKIDPVKLEKVINQLKIKNGQQSSSYLAKWAERFLKIPPGHGNAYATAAEKAYFGLK